MTAFRFVAIVGTRHELTMESRDLLACEVVRIYQSSDVIVTGDCESGVDSMSRGFARANRYPLYIIEAFWNLLGNPKAAHVRNDIIARTTDILLAFPCRHSKGTYDTIRRCKARGIENQGFEVECTE